MIYFTVYRTQDKKILRIGRCELKDLAKQAKVDETAVEGRFPVSFDEAPKTIEERILDLETKVQELAGSGG